jgi:hypothetical protein
MKQNNRKSSGSGVFLWLFILLIGFLANNEDILPLIRRYRAVVFPALVTLVLILLIVWFSSRVAAGRKAAGKEHTHDRIDTISYDVNETEAEHYKKQLDGFLKAGIIEKEEYRLLLQRYTSRR